MNRDALFRQIDEDREEIVETMCSMLRVKAIGPESGGDGERARADLLLQVLEMLGLTNVEVLESPDQRVPCRSRPNIVVRVPGRTRKTLWVVTHMDTVAEGDVGAWASPPFEPRIADGRIYCRGAEDNGQALMASLHGLACLVKARVTPELDVSLAFVSDEEHGNMHGIEFLLNEGLFEEGDLVVVPDHGSPDGSDIEVVEKSISWVEVEVLGVQTHASTPDRGANALEAAARFLIAAVDQLRRKYSSSNPVFDVPRSTFEPTRSESSASSINIIPGKCRFAFDFRVLPEYPLDRILEDLRSIAGEIEKTTGTRILLGTAQRADAPPMTPESSAVVRRLSSAIATVKPVKPRPIGIGGGTCATPFRREGYEAVVWATVDGVAHDANEYCVIDNLIDDTKVFAALFVGDTNANQEP